MGGRLELEDIIVYMPSPCRRGLDTARAILERLSVDVDSGLARVSTPLLDHAVEYRGREDEGALTRYILHAAGALEALGIHVPLDGIARAAACLARALDEVLAREEERGTPGGAGEEPQEAPGAVEGGEWRRLPRALIGRIVEALVPVYEASGARDDVARFLAGWLAAARIHPDDARRVLEGLGEGDPGGVVARAYAGPGDPQGSGGRRGLLDVASEVVGREKALDIIRLVEEALGVASPWLDPVFVLIDYDRQVYAVADYHALAIFRAQRRDDRIIYREKVVAAVPMDLHVYRDPSGGVTKYSMRWMGRTLRRPLPIGPAPIDDIVARLRVEGLVFHSRLAPDVIAAVIDGLIAKGRATEHEEFPAPGFYWVDDRLEAVGWTPEEPSREELEAALDLLDELAEKWYSHAVDRYATAVKWGLVAPFGYAMKTRDGSWLPALALYGAAKTGKTTLAEIVLALWGLGPRHLKTGASIDTVPRLGHVVSMSTFPVVINEPGPAFKREDVADTIKNAIEKPLARSRYVRGTYVNIPALATFIFTTNRALPPDDAILRRMLIIKFTYNDRIPDEKIEEFNREARPRLPALRAIGRWVAARLTRDPSLLARDWRNLADQLIEELYRTAGRDPPAWAAKWAQHVEDPYETIIDTVREILVERVNQAYYRAHGRAPPGDQEGEPLERRLRVVLEERLLPWAFMRGENVHFTTGFAREVSKHVGDVGGLRGLADLLGWTYAVVKHGGHPVRTISVYLDDLAQFLS